jgi:hypothetical protein
MNRLSMRVEVNPTIPEDQIQFRNKEGECIGLIYNIGKPKAIEPDAFYSPSHAARERGELKDCINKVITNEGTFTRLQVPSWNPSPMMRALGYDRNPATCSHDRKRFIRTWVCSQCGIGLDEDGNA